MLLIALSLATAHASDSGMQRVYDRQVDCAIQIDPRPDPTTCRTEVRRSPPDDDLPTWAIRVSPPGKLFVSHHAAAVDWGGVHHLRSPRAFDPILLTTGMRPDPACPDEQVQFIHLDSEHGGATAQSCIDPPFDGHGVVLVDAHRTLPTDRWVPIWARVPDDPARASDIRSWFYVQIYLSMDGSTPSRPPQHAYPSVQALTAQIPGAVPPRAGTALVPAPHGDRVDGG